MHPSIIDTKDEVPSLDGFGKALNFSVFGKDISTSLLLSLDTSSYILGTLWIVCGPKTKSTKGALLIIFSPSWLATQPPTPIFSLGFFFFKSFHLPSSWKTFSWAFSLIEQVFSNIKSAFSGWSTMVRSWLSPRISFIRLESYSFIWHPWVLMYKFLPIQSYI